MLSGPLVPATDRDKSMTHIFGCWTLDPEQPALVNTSTGEQLSFRESGLIDRPHEALGWIRFDYRHSDLRYAVFVKCVMSSNESLTWTIDHVRSASVWREETNAADAFPPYGAWRRVDDCVTDALVSWWHSRAAEGPRFKHVTAQGGWLNGQWKPDFARHLGRLSRNQNPKPEPASTTTLRSWIMPLTEPPPSPWSFRDVPDDWRLKEATPRRSFLDRNPFDLHFPLRGLADLRHAGDRYPKVPELSLPATVSLSAWEGEMACLLAQDGKRVLYPCWAEVPGTCSQNLAETHICGR